MSAGQLDLLSIGHSNAPLGRILDLLAANDVDVVADVRTYPRSKYVPHFDAAPLRSTLLDHAIRYVLMGTQLGGRPSSESFYDAEGHVRYDLLSQSASFNDGLTRLLEGCSRYRVAILCSEEDPAGCHRHLLIGRVLVTRGIDMGHIRHDGRVELDSSLAGRLSPLGGGSLFEAEGPAWRSVRSVSRGRARVPSSPS